MLAAAVRLPDPPADAVTIAICATDPALRDRLAQNAGGNAGIRVAGVVGDPTALARLLERTGIELVLVEAATPEQVRRWTRRHRDTAFVVIAPDAQAGALDLLRAGARAVLPRDAGAAEIAVALAAVRRGLCVLPQSTFSAQQPAAAAAEEPSAGNAALTARERDVLAALADGLSNKVIARRLGISFHTVKFHVAGILAKLDADSRTEAVTKATQLGLVML
jgi:two-component system, NarL family, nitrate/nitrite response regulator NarL